MRKTPKWVWGLLGLAALVVLLKFTVLKTKPVVVEVATVDVGVVEETITNTRAGTVKARDRARLSPQVGGRVQTLPFAKGAAVPAGALLLQLDDSLQRADLQLAEEQVRTAEAQAAEAALAAELAERDWQRAEALSKESILSKQDLDTIQTRRDQALAAQEAAEAALGQARARLELARVQVDLTRIRAPFAGILADRSTEVGEWITPSPPGVPIPPVLDLLDPSTVYVSAPIDELDAARVQVGQHARITVDSFPGKIFEGAVTRVAPYVLDVQEQNRTLEVEVDFAEGARPQDLLPGTSADVEILLGQRRDVLRVPTSAIAEGGKVLVVQAGYLAEKTVQTGLSNWRTTEVTGGLSEGDRVVTSRDSTEIKPGVRVEIRSSPASVP